MTTSRPSTAPRWRREAEHPTRAHRGRPRRRALERGGHLRPGDLGARHHRASPTPTAAGPHRRTGWRRWWPPILFFVSLLAHEGSHAVSARRHGVGVRSITLWLFGGVAQLEGEAHSPGADFTIAAVGPATSIVLAGVFGGAQLLLERAGAHGPGRGASARGCGRSTCSWPGSTSSPRHRSTAAASCGPGCGGAPGTGPAPRCRRRAPGWGSAWS